MTQTTVAPKGGHARVPYIFIGDEGCTLTSQYLVDSGYETKEVHNRTKEYGYMPKGIYKLEQGEYTLIADWSHKAQERERSYVYETVVSARIAAKALASKAAEAEAIERETKARFEQMEKAVQASHEKLTALQEAFKKAEEDRKIKEARDIKELNAAKLAIADREAAIKEKLAENRIEVDTRDIGVKEVLADNTILIDDRTATLHEENSYFDRQLKLLDKVWENDAGLLKALELSMTTGVDGKAFASVFNRAGPGGFDVSSMSGALSGVLSKVSNKEYLKIVKALHESRNSHVQALSISLLRPDKYGLLPGYRSLKKKERKEIAGTYEELLTTSVKGAESQYKKSKRSKSSKARNYVSDEMYQDKLRMFAGVQSGYASYLLIGTVLSAASVLAVSAGMFFGIPALAVAGFAMAGITLIGAVVAFFVG